MSAKISLLNFFPQPNLFQRIFFRFLDRILGITKMNTLYQDHQMQGLSKEDFVDKLLDVQQITVTNETSLLDQIP